MELSVTPEWRGSARARVWGARARHERGAADCVAGGVRSNVTLDSSLSLVLQTTSALDRGSLRPESKAWEKE
jgi:hypothetical protein